jgi:hypothetical protein
MPDISLESACLEIKAPSPKSGVRDAQLNR